MKAAQIRLNLSNGILQMVVAVYVKLLPASYLVEGVEELAIVGVGVGVLLQRGGALSHTHTHRHTHTHKRPFPCKSAGPLPDALLQVSVRTHNSSLEGAMKLKFAPFCSS